MKTFTKFKHISALMLALVFAFLQPSTSIAQSCSLGAQITNGPLINLCSGASVVLDAQPKGGGLSYQWQEQTTVGGPFANISGAIFDTYTTSTLGAYRVIVDNGLCSDTSSITNVVNIVINGGTISGGVGAIICPGSSAGTFIGTSVPGYDLGIVNFQWQMKIGAGVWMDIAGATGLIYTSPLVNTTTQFRRMATDNCGNSAFSNTLNVDVFAPLNSGTIEPASQTILAGDIPSTINNLTAPFGGSGVYQTKWQSSNVSLGPWNDIPGASGLSYQPPALFQTTYYRRATYDSCGTMAATPVVEVIVSNSILNGGDMTSPNSCVFPGQIPSILTSRQDASGGTAPYTYVWQYNDGSGWIDIPSSNAPVYQPTTTITQNTTFRRKVIDAANDVAYSNEFTFGYITTPLNAGTIEATSNVACIGSSPGIIKSVTSPSGFGELLPYQWQQSTSASGPWVNIEGATLGDYQPGPLTQKTYFRRTSQDKCGATVRDAFTNVVEIDIRPAFFGGEISPSTQSIYPGGTPAQLSNVTSPFGGTGSYTLGWEKADLAVGPWTTIGGEVGLNYQSGALNQSTYFRRVAKDNNCLAVKYSFVVEVFTNLVAPLDGGTINGGDCVFSGYIPETINNTLDASGGLTPLTYQWESKTLAGSFAPIAGANGASFTPTVAVTETTVFRRKVTDAYNNTAYSNEFTVVVTPLPLDAGSITPTANAVCANQPITINGTAAVNPGITFDYAWETRTESGTWTIVPGVSTQNYGPINISEKTYFRRLITATCGGVSLNFYSNEVVVNIGSTGSLSGGTIITASPSCLNAGTSPGKLTGTAVSGASGYQWEVKYGNGPWTDIGGAIGQSYTPGALHGTVSFRRKVVDACGGFAYSNIKTFNVLTCTLGGGIIDGPVATCEGTTPGNILNILAPCNGSSSYSYQWEINNGMGWNNIPGATTSTYSPDAISFTTTYRRKVTDACGNTAYSNEVTILVYPPINPGFIEPANQSICPGAVPAVISSIADCYYSVGGVSYQWQVAESCNCTGNTITWTDIPGANGPTYQPPASMENKKYRLKVTGLPCGNVQYTNVAEVNIGGGINCRIANPNNQNVNTGGSQQQDAAPEKPEGRLAAITESKALNVYPNPTVAGSTIRVSVKNRTTPMAITFQSIDGRIYGCKVRNAGSGQLEVTLPESLARGTYLLQVSSETEQWSKKIVIR